MLNLLFDKAINLTPSREFPLALELIPVMFEHLLVSVLGAFGSTEICNAGPDDMDLLLPRQDYQLIFITQLIRQDTFDLGATVQHHDIAAEALG